MDKLRSHLDTRLAKKATHQLTKKHNRDLVLQTIFNHETISRAGIARITHLTRTTVSDVVAGLIAEGLVQELGPGSSLGGKPSILLSIAADSRYLIGMNLAQDKFTGSLVNLRGKIEKTVEVPVTGQDGREAIQVLRSALDKLVKSEWKPVVGVGVGTPGLINTRDGIVLNAVNLDWQDLPLARLLEKRYHVPVRLLNDSQAAAIGEYVYGNHGADGNLIVVNVSHGIGAGILIRGRLFEGDGGGAGEIGHVRVVPDTAANGLTCRCGHRGCMETLASGRAILQAAQRLPQLSGVTDLDTLEAKFYEGNSAVEEIVLNAGHHLGTAIGGLVGTLNIKKIVLTGAVTRFGERWLDTVRQAMSRAALERMTQDTQLEIGRLDARACILGSAAYLLLDDYSLLFS
jgi:predicted NBD/HSP70 family sugar kinase